jgi:ABC-2 type transport system ATP-binding protein
VLFSTHVTSDLERIADFITFIHDGKLVFTLPRDELRDRWGIVKGNGHLPERLAGLPVRGVRKGPYGVEALVADVAAARELCGSDTVIDRASLDDVMVFMTRGESHVDAR